MYSAYDWAALLSWASIARGARPARARSWLTRTSTWSAAPGITAAWADGVPRTTKQEAATARAARASSATFISLPSAYPKPHEAAFRQAAWAIAAVAAAGFF